MSTNNFTPLFSTPVATVQIQKNTDILQTCDATWEKTYPHTDEGAWGFSPNNNRVLEDYPEIKQILLYSFISFSEEILGICDKFDISASWLTKAEKGNSTPLHSHANSFWNGVYYYGENYDSSSPLVFEHPLVDYLKNYGCCVPPIKSTPFNNLEQKIIPVKNNLIFFPSYLKHKVPKHEGEFPRYSLSFNIIPVGQYGTYDSLYDTKWFN